MLRHLIITGTTYYYIITAARATFHGFIISNIEGSTVSAKKYLIIKRTLFSFRKKFATTSNKKRQKKKWVFIRRMALTVIFVRPVL